MNLTKFKAIFSYPQCHVCPNVSAKQGLIPASPSKGQNYEPPKGDVVGEGFTCLIVMPATICVYFLMNVDNSCKLSQKSLIFGAEFSYILRRTDNLISA